jgi:hypothetical protein
VRDTTSVVHWESGNVCEDEAWEAAYERFETPEEEIRKFLRRFRRLGLESLSRSSQVVELFCGRGNGLVAFEQMGFRSIEGVDLSPGLMARYRGPAQLYVGDCRQLHFDEASKDLVIVQGGLHHLPSLTTSNAPSGRSIAFSNRLGKSRSSSPG